MNWIYSPFIIPIAGIFVAIVAIISGAINQAHSRRVRADQRMAMLARGIPLPEIESALGASDVTESMPQLRDPLRRLHNTRVAALILIGCGLGLVIFFVLLEIILQVRPVLAGAAAGIIPLAIGGGFWVDYTLQRRDMASFGLSVEDEKMGRMDKITR